MIKQQQKTRIKMVNAFVKQVMGVACAINVTLATIVQKITPVLVRQYVLF